MLPALNAPLLEDQSIIHALCDDAVNFIADIFILFREVYVQFLEVNAPFSTRLPPPKGAHHD
jgi:hypothetical protein